MFYPTPISDEEREVLDAGREAGRQELLRRIVELEAENERLKERNEECEYWRVHWKAKAFEALSRTGAVKALDEDDYEKIIDAAAITMRKATSGVRGQVITVQDSLDWWVMKETERRVLSALEPAAPEGEQEAVDQDLRDAAKAMGAAVAREMPLVGATIRPAEQAVTEAMVEAGLEYYAEGGCGGLADYERREVVEAIIEAALQAAMEAGRHE